MRSTRRGASTVAALILAAQPARAQEAPAVSDAASSEASGASEPEGSAPRGGTSTSSPPVIPGLTGGASVAPLDVNAGLDASSRPATAGAVGRDGFDFRASREGAEAIRGSSNGSYVVSGQFVPEIHAAKRGDTLWEISRRYFGNAYNWPRLWSFNRQIQNPHWIYPGDHIRLREPSVQPTRLTGGLARFNPKVPSSTVFQRHVGFVLDGPTAAWGEIVGSPDDQMILSHQDVVYVQLEGDRPYRVGQRLLVFEPRAVEPGPEHPQVWVRGVIELDRVNPRTKMARARVVEALSEIHRGCKVAPHEREVDAITPVTNKKTVQARVVGALHPFEFYAADQVVFIDKGREDGLEVGNRLVAVQRADRWSRDVANVGRFGGVRALVEDGRVAETERVAAASDDALFPAETYGELIVTRVGAKTATCLIVGASYEIPRGAVLIAREGY